MTKDTAALIEEAKRSIVYDRRGVRFEMAGDKDSLVPRLVSALEAAEAAHAVLLADVVELRTKLADAENVVEPARESFDANDDGHRCPRDGSECPQCMLKDALSAYDAAREAK